MANIKQTPPNGIGGSKNGTLGIEIQTLMNGHRFTIQDSFAQIEVLAKEFCAERTDKTFLDMAHRNSLQIQNWTGVILSRLHQIRALRWVEKQMGRDK